MLFGSGFQVIPILTYSLHYLAGMFISVMQSGSKTVMVACFPNFFLVIVIVGAHNSNLVITSDDIKCTGEI